MPCLIYQGPIGVHNRGFPKVSSPKLWSCNSGHRPSSCSGRPTMFQLLLTSPATAWSWPSGVVCSCCAILGFAMRPWSTPCSGPVGVLVVCIMPCACSCAGSGRHSLAGVEKKAGLHQSLTPCCSARVSSSECLTDSGYILSIGWRWVLARAKAKACVAALARLLSLEVARACQAPLSPRAWATRTKT